MTDLRKNIHRYMELKGIKNFTSLLVMIGRELGKEDSYEFAVTEKSNFSKMLKGERPLKHEYIIPMEKIFGVSMARIMDEEAYLLPVNKEDIPFVKGYRYYAYKDDPKLYETEFEQMLFTTEGTWAIFVSDEFDKMFLDYVIEYRSINALRYLINKHGMKPAFNSTQYFQIGNSFLHTTLGENQLIRMIIQEDDEEVFLALADPLLFMQYTILFEKVKNDSLTFDLILRSQNIFASLFKPKNIRLKDLNHGIVGHEDDWIPILHPYLNLCLNYAIDHLNKYKEQAKKILEFGIQYNEKFLRETGEDRSRLLVDEEGKVTYWGRETLGNIVFTAKVPKDKEINKLLDRLPKPKYVGKNQSDF